MDAIQDQYRGLACDRWYLLRGLPCTEAFTIDSDPSPTTE